MPSPSTELHRELGRILGYFSPQAPDVPSRDLGLGNVVVYSHPKATGASAEVTAAHEQTHSRLTNSTTYGRFFKQIAGGRHERQAELLDRLLAAQWQSQECAATYVGLVAVASDSGQLDRLVSHLPSGALGQSPYREAFDAVDALFPLAQAADHLELSAHVMLVEAISTWALSGDVLRRFRTPGTLTVASLETYLAAHAPDRRLEAMFARLRSDSDRRELVGEVKATILEVAEAAEGFPDDAFWRLAARLQGLLPLDSNSNLDHRRSDVRRFWSAWSTDSEVEAEQAWTKDLEPEPSKSPPPPLPEVIVGGQHLVPYTTGLVELRPGDRADIGYTAAELADTTRGPRSLLLAVALPSFHGRLHFRPTVYPTAEDGVNPSHPEAAFLHLVESSGPIHVCDPDDFVASATSLGVPVSALVFISHAWTHWHLRWQEAREEPIVLDGFGPPWKDGFGEVVRICIEADLSEYHLMMLLAGAGLFEAPECFMIGYGREQYVACMLDRTRPFVYLLQLLSGTLGFRVFEQIAQRRGMRVLDIAEEAPRIPHLPLLEFVGKSMVLEAVSRSPF